MNVRIRGIYTTALTRLFREAGHTVVDASPPIRRRFDGEFPNAPPDVVVRTTEDRQGVGLDGSSDAVTTARDLLADVGIDAFAWDDPLPVGAVVEGRVTETLGGGAVIETGTTDAGGRAVEAYLPYGNVDDRVETGDAVRAQVVEAVEPWGSHRPELDAALRARGGLVTLEPGSGMRVDARDDAAARELAGMTDLLGIEAPDGWRTVWGKAALDADMSELQAGLERAVERAEALADAVGETGIIDDPQPDFEPGLVATPTGGAWVWFGRECRFALDDHRRAVETTMPGHHRTKAGAEAASAGVDLAEALVEPDPDTPFPFETVREVFGPAVGDSIRLEHGKPDGRRIVLGEGAVTEADAEGVTLEREMTPGGTYDELDVQREAGDVAVTKLQEGRWWYPTTYRSADGEVRGTYVNVCTPVEIFPDAARYVDLHVDVVKHADGTVERVDDDILDASVAAGNTPEPVAEKARSVATALQKAFDS